VRTKPTSLDVSDQRPGCVDRESTALDARTSRPALLALDVDSSCSKIERGVETLGSKSLDALSAEIRSDGEMRVQTCASNLRADLIHPLDESRSRAEQGGELGHESRTLDCDPVVGGRCVSEMEERIGSRDNGSRPLDRNARPGGGTHRARAGLDAVSEKNIARRDLETPLC